MPKASSLSTETKHSFLFKSSPGFGKTLAAATFALEGPVHLAYWDKKTPIELVTHFRRFGEKGQRILDNLEYDCYGSANAADYLNKLIEMNKNGCRYVALINDSVTYMTSSVVNWALNFDRKAGQEIKKLKELIPSFDEYKVETSFVMQAIDLSKNLPAHIIWTAHPVPRIKVEEAGASIRVTNANSIVSHGGKVAGMIPGGFTEQYHFSQRHDWSTSGGSSKKYICSFEAIGDEFAKSSIFKNFKEIDFTDKFFYEVWKEKLREDNELEKEKMKNEVNNQSNQSTTNPFQTNPEDRWK